MASPLLSALVLSPPIFFALFSPLRPLASTHLCLYPRMFTRCYSFDTSADVHFSLLSPHSTTRQVLVFPTLSFPSLVFPFPLSFLYTPPRALTTPCQLSCPSVSNTHPSRRLKLLTCRWHLPQQPCASLPPARPSLYCPIHHQPCSYQTPKSRLVDGCSLLLTHSPHRNLPPH